MSFINAVLRALRSPQRSKPKPTGIKRKVIDLDFMESVGQYAESTDGTYRLTWSQFFSDGDDPHGAYVLKRGNSKLCSGKLERPNDGKVARNGTFILTDWCFGNALKSRVYGFSSDGDQILKHEFRANAINTGISDK